MQQLGVSLNAVHLHDVFEDDVNVHMVMELCEGGALLERVESGRYSERYISFLVRSILRFIAQCHAKVRARKQLGMTGVCSGDCFGSATPAPLCAAYCATSRSATTRWAGADCGRSGGSAVAVWRSGAVGSTCQPDELPSVPAVCTTRFDPVVLALCLSTANHVPAGHHLP